MPRRDNLVLIGMPGCGKTTVGQLLVRRLKHQQWEFIDLDDVIEQAACMKLWEINEAEGHAGLRRREEAAAVAFDGDRCILSPGGSVVYSEPAMRHLTSIATVIYLHVPADLLEIRAGDLKVRGVIIRDGMTYADLVAERDPLYRKWAHHVVDCGDADASVVARQVKALLNETPPGGEPGGV